MGFVSDVMQNVKKFFRTDKERVAYNVAKSATRNPIYYNNSTGLDYNSHSALSDYLQVETDLLNRYADYELMNETAEVASALDVYADDGTVRDFYLKRSVWVTSDDRVIQRILDDLFQKTLRIDEEIWEIARNLCMYGFSAHEILYTGEGVRGLNFMPTPTVRRIEGPRGELFGFIQDFKSSKNYTPADFNDILNKKVKYFSNSDQNLIGYPTNYGEPIALEPEEVVNFRLSGSPNRGALYGFSILEAGRHVWRRLILLEDSALIYRLQKSQERYAFFVDTGDTPGDEVPGELRKFKQELKKKKYIDPTTNLLNVRMDLLTPEEDLFIATRNGVDSSRIQILGGANWQCLTGDTKIPLLDGTAPTIKELTDKGPDHTFWVYSIDENGNVVPGKGYYPRVTHENAEIWEITLDNGEVIKCTGNHPFMMRDGTYIQAQHLQTNASLMPLYREKSSHSKKGDYLNGYEKVYNPSAGKYEYTHHIVYKNINECNLKDIWNKGEIIHHENHKKYDNSPENLKALHRKEHAKEHRENAKRLHTPEVFEKLKILKQSEKFREKLKKGWENDSDRKAGLIERNKKMMQNPINKIKVSENIIKWNTSKEKTDKMRGKNHFKFRNISLDEIAKLFIENNCTKMTDLFRKNKLISQGVVERVLNENNLNWSEFAALYIPGYKVQNRVKKGGFYKKYEYKNHKVVSVKNTCLYETVYDISVEKYHNFSIGQGVFVHNSMNDIQYFLDKLLAALKIPKIFLGQTEGALPKNLSAIDVRFARTIMRIQRELINGLEKIARMHLSALGINPETVNFEIHMSSPSSILEMGQLEVKNLQAAFAQAMGLHVSQYWILSKIFNMPDTEIQGIFRQQEDEQKRQIALQMQAQSAMQDMQMQAQQQQMAAMQQAQGMQQQQGMGQPPNPYQQQQGQPMMSSLYLPRSVQQDLIEKKLMHGQRQHEKELNSKLEAVLKNDQKLQSTVSDLHGLIEDIKYRGLIGDGNNQRSQAQSSRSRIIK